MNNNLNTFPVRAAAYIAERKLDRYGVSDSTLTGRRADLKTPAGKPVVVYEFESDKHGRRIDVGRGSFDGGDLVMSQTVKLEEEPGGNLPAIRPVSREEAFQVIKDLFRAK